jgi:Uma2 family endonuclease
MATEIAKKLFTVYDYHKMGDAGILRHDDRVELIRGEIVEMSPINPRHNGTINRANRALVSIVGNAAVVGVQGSIRLNEYSEPQPDFCLLRSRDDFYTTTYATPKDILLIIEVSDTSLNYDRKVKMQLYAETGVPEYWISDLQADRVVTYCDPAGVTYQTVREFHRGAHLTPQQLPDCRIPVESLLP